MDLARFCKTCHADKTDEGGDVDDCFNPLHGVSRNEKPREGKFVGLLGPT
jgi:hypothetical protein